MSNYTKFAYPICDDFEEEKYYSVDTVYYAIADIIFEDNIYDIVKDKLTEPEMVRIITNLSKEIKEANINIDYYMDCLKDYFAEKDSEV